MRRAVDQLPTLVTELMAAWSRRDQRSLRELSFQLVTAAAPLPMLSAVAAELEERLRARDILGTQRCLLALLGETGSLRSRGILPATIPQQARCS